MEFSNISRDGIYSSPMEQSRTCRDGAGPGLARHSATRQRKENPQGEDMERKPIKEVSADARLLYQRLAKMDVGDFVSYKELGEIIGRDVQNEARGYLNTARLMCEREENKTFGVIINEGLKCLNGSEIVNTAAFSIGHIKRTSRRSMRRLRCIEDLSALGNDEKIKLNAYASILGVMATMAKQKNIRKIEAKVQETQEQLPYVKTLDAFK